MIGLQDEDYVRQDEDATHYTEPGYLDGAAPPRPLQSRARTFLDAGTARTAEAVNAHSHSQGHAGVPENVDDTASELLDMPGFAEIPDEQDEDLHDDEEGGKFCMV
jgi:hypothetical protein